jgi:hypothetical protein
MKKMDLVTRLCTFSLDDGTDALNKLLTEAATEIERFYVLLEVFDAHYICEDCAKLSATYLENCQNPLHKLHDAAWENEQ